MNRRLNHFLGMVVTSALAVMSLGGCKDTSSDLAPTPELKNLTPNALTWEAEDMEPKVIEIEGNDLEGARITLSALEDFSAELDGTTITVAPIWVNDSDDNVINVLTVSLKGGKTLTAILTQKKQVREPELFGVTPEALTWAAGETAGKTVEVAGEYLEGKVLVVTLPETSNFTATAAGTTVTVTPKAANTTYEPVVETLTVSVDDCVPFTVTLTQEAKPRPSLTSLTPNALSWAAVEMEPKTVTVAGENLEGVTITATVEGDAFTATVEGTVVTVTPTAANEGDAAVTATLTVSVEGGSSLEATLTQAKPVDNPTLTALTPDALSWAAVEMEPKTITAVGELLDDATIVVSETTYFDVAVEGTIVTVTPKATNATYEAVVETLTVSLEGGNSLTATLTQEAKPRPTLTSLTPNSLTWAATETDSKTVTVAGDNLEGATITATVDGTAFTVELDGTTVTVTPVAANEGTADVTATLTVSVEDGNSLTVTLTQAKPKVEGAEPGWYQVTETKANWNGNYLVVAKLPNNGKGKCWTTETGQVINSFDLTIENDRITASPKVETGGDLADLVQYAVTIEEIEGGYSFYSAAKKWYLATKDDKVGSMKAVNDSEEGASSTIGATSIAVNSDGTVAIKNSAAVVDGANVDKWMYYNKGANAQGVITDAVRKFNYFPQDILNNGVQGQYLPIYLYEWRE